MRIALVANPYVQVPPPKYGGIEQVVYYLIKGLKAAGHEPVLLGPADSTVDCEIVPTSQQALFFPKKSSEVEAHRREVKRINKVTTQKLKSILPRVDIIHSHSFDMTPFKHFPNVTTLHNTLEFEHLAYFLKRRDLPYISISQNQQAVCPELNYVGVVYNGEDPDEFPTIKKPENYLCFLGRFDRDKNPHLAIQLALSLNMKIKLAGKIDYKSEGYFEEEVAKYFDHPLIEYLGELGFEDKVKLLSNAACNLHPTNFREPFGLTVLEAAYCGTPTLAIARGSMPELIEPGRTGILVEDFMEARAQIEECFKMDRDYISLRARRLFNYQSMTESYVQIYKDVIATHPRPTPYWQRLIAQLHNRLRKIGKQTIA